MLDPVVGAFLLTLAVSFLIGIGLREYYEGEGKYDTFGTARTFVFIGMLGFVLYNLPGIGRWAYLLGFVSLTLFLLIYYGSKALQKKSPGMIGVLVGLITYATGPVALHEPNWYLVLLGISVLFTVHSKGRIRRFTDKLKTGEIVTVCKFLAIVGVVLPLIPNAMPKYDGLFGQFLATLPVTPRQIWMAVVITTGISYFGYVLQTYFFPNKGLLLTGVIGGIYSSTVTVLVLAKKSRRAPDVATDASVAILLAGSMMYLRLLALVAIFRFRAAVVAAPPLLILSAVGALYAIALRRRSRRLLDPADAAGDLAREPEMQRNPLEINSAVVFAFLFTVISLATKYVLDYANAGGLRVLSFVVGLSDITPFVVSLLQGDYGIGDARIVQAVLIASASNNVLKTAYTYMFGLRRTANLAAPGMVVLALPTILYALWML
jgi:uncharacterized membrane protein (DUF4010 family)